MSGASPPSERQTISPWYNVVRGDELMQGDIIADCPVLIFVDEPEGEGGIGVRRRRHDVILLSQSCDLVREQGKAKLEQVTLCALARHDEVCRLVDHALPTVRFTSRRSRERTPSTSASRRSMIPPIPD